MPESPNPDDYALLFEATISRSGIDRFLTGIRLSAELTGPGGRVGEVARLSAWRHAPGRFAFAEVDDRLVAIFGSVSDALCATARQVLRCRRALARHYDEARRGGRPPVGIVLLEPFCIEPAMRGSDVGLRLLGELQGLLCGAPHVVAMTLRPADDPARDHPPQRSAADPRRACSRSAPTLRRLVQHYTSDSALVLEQVTPTEPSLLTAYWSGANVRLPDQDGADLSTDRLHALLASLGLEAPDTRRRDRPEVFAGLAGPDMPYSKRAAG